MFVLFEWVVGRQWAAYLMNAEGIRLVFLGYHFEKEGVSIEGLRLELERDIRKVFNAKG